VLLAAAIACRPDPAAGPGVGQTPPSAPARAIHVSDDGLTLEGRWQPIDGADATFGAHGVRVRCERGAGRCREEEAAARAEGRKSGEGDYRVEEWTKAKVVAARTDGPAQTKIQISLTSPAAVKTVLVRRGKKLTESRWRLE
jgi:hypothetical protein